MAKGESCNITEDGRELINAVQQSDAEKVRALLEGGADPRTRMSCSEPLFLNATRNRQTQIMAAFIAHGLPPDEFRDSGNRTALQLCAMSLNREAAIMLLENGANPNCDIQEDGFSLLHFAAFNNDAELCVKLLEKGANATARTSHGEDIFAMAGDEAAEAIKAHISLKKSRRLHSLRQRRAHTYPQPKV